MEDSLKKRYFIKLFSNLVNGLVNVILVAFVPQALGPLVYGQFTYLQQFFSQLINLLDAGTSMAYFTKLAKQPKRLDLTKFYIYYTIFLFTLLSLFIYILYSINYIEFFFNDIPISYIFDGMIFGFLTWIIILLIYISDANALTASVELIKITHKIVALLVLLVFLKYFYLDLERYYLYNIISLFLFIIIILFLLINRNLLNSEVLKIKINVFTLVKEFYIFSSPLFILNLFSVIATLFDMWLLQKMSGIQEVGFYGLAYSIAAMCFLFTSALTPIITREFAKLYEQNNFEEMKKIFIKYIPLLYIVATYFSVFISYESENVILVFTDEDFLNASLVLSIMAYYPLHQTYGQLSGSVLYVSEQTKLVKNIGIFITLLGILFSIVLIFILNLGAIGLAWKMIIAQIISVNIQLFFNAKFLKMNLLKFILHQIYAVVFFILVIYFVDTILFFSFESRLTELVVSGFIYTLLVIISILLLPTMFGISKNDFDQIKDLLRKGKRGGNN